ncbi:hypothetical protein AGOR_G00220940 [Albula goreensis]|uniref:Shisa N-terminal domain-containing protein n=1 Tax=Albula goreensis TaxID=1534307 RepID=A0A8T3CFQ2_9TELE|nr:hypothetical protein AGOR_G00220940 [Albula goreensis]
MAVSCLLGICFWDFYENWSSPSLSSLLSAAVGKISDKEEFRMSRAGLLLGYFVVKVLALVCNAEGEPGQQQLEGFAMVSANDSREAEGLPEPPHIEDRCRGYYDVMGQWDPPFVCRTASYLYCCGTCGFRFCCAYKTSRLDQSKCSNYDTPLWMMTGRPPSKKNDRTHDPTRDKTNLIVYIVCGVVAIMALVGIFTKLGLEKAHRPHRENMTRALASVMQQQMPGSRDGLEREVTVGAQGGHYESMQARASSLQTPQMNSLGTSMGHPSSLAPNMNQTLSQTMSQTLPHTMGQNMGQPINQPMGQNLAHSIGQNLPHPMSQTLGHSMGHPMSQTLGHSMGQNMGHSLGHSMGQTLPHSIGQSLGHSVGHSMGHTLPHTIGHSLGHSMGQSLSHMGQTLGHSVNQNIPHSMGQTLGHSVNQNISHSMGQNLGHSVNQNIPHSMGQTLGHSVNPNISHSMGQNLGHSANQNISHSMGQTLGHSVNQNISHSMGQNLGHSANQNISHSMGQNLGHSANQNISHSMGQNLSHSMGQSMSHTISHSLGHSVAQKMTQPMAHTLPQPMAQTLGPSLAHTLPQPVATHVPAPVSHAYHTLGQLSHAYEQPPSAKDLSSSKYASLKAVAEKAGDSGSSYYSSRRQMVDFAVKGSLPLHPVRLDHGGGGGAPYSTEMTCTKQNGHRAKASGRVQVQAPPPHPLAYATHTIGSPPGPAPPRGGWGGSVTLGRRQSYGTKRQYGLEQNPLRSAHSHHFLSPQAFCITNSKTEVTV